MTVRDPTQSLEVESGDELDALPSASAHPSIALGTHESGPEHGRSRTRIESPSGRHSHQRQPPPVPAHRASSDDPEDRVGATLGSYRLVELLGKGGMGYVYRAEHTKLGREVALKLLRGDYAKRRDAVARFFQEARTVNRVRHRNIVDVTDFVELDDGTTFIIMELLDGTSLGKWARSGVDETRALAVLVQICDGLAAAHHVGVIHRDLKPDNVIVVPTPDGAEQVKLLDFGVAKLLNQGDEDIGFQTAAGSVIGTPAYMSPEQAGGMPIDGRSDIYSLGAIMYELFTGQPMFRGRSFGEYVRKHLTEPLVPPRMTAGGSSLDARLDAIICRCLEKQPSARYQGIEELRDALLQLLAGTDVRAVPQPVPVTATGQRPLPTTPPVLRAPTPISQVQSALHFSAQAYSGPHSSLGSVAQPPTGTAHVAVPTPWWVWLGGGALAVALGVGGAVWYAGRGGESTPAPAPVAATPAGAPEAPKPVVTPAVKPVAPPATLVEVRVDSLPAGGVYADGHSAELCHTPCSFHIDPSDGGPPDHRTFLVRSDGYQDGIVAVDLQQAQRDFHVTLERLAPAPIAKRPKPVSIEKKPPPPPPEPEVKKPDPEPPKKPDPKPSGTIDPSDTLDPFHRK